MRQRPAGLTPKTLHFHYKSIWAVRGEALPGRIPAARGAVV